MAGDGVARGAFGEAQDLRGDGERAAAGGGEEDERGLGPDAVEEEAGGEVLLGQDEARALRGVGRVARGRGEARRVRGAGEGGGGDVEARGPEAAFGVGRDVVGAGEVVLAGRLQPRDPAPGEGVRRGVAVEEVAEEEVRAESPTVGAA